MTISSPEAPSTPTGHSPSGAAAVAQEQIAGFFFSSDPAPVVTEALDQTARTWQMLDQSKMTMALHLAGLREAGALLLEQGGHRSLASWMAANLGMGRREATDLARLALCFHRQELPETAIDFWAGFMSLGEAVLIARVVERETKKRDAAHADAGAYARLIETELVEHKRQIPQATVADLDRLAIRLRHRHSPERVEHEEKQIEDGRGAKLAQGRDGSFVFQAWGSGLDGALLQAALERFADPFEAEVPREERDYQAFMNLVRSTEGEQEQEHPARPGPVALINITVPVSTLLGQEGDDPAVADSGQVLFTSQVRAMLGENLVRYLITDAQGTTVAASDRRRTVSDRVRAAAFAGHTTCAWAQGCDVPLRYTQADHKVEFHRGGASTAENIQPLCSMHNRLKHRLQVAKDRRFWKGRPGTSPRPLPKETEAEGAATTATTGWRGKQAAMTTMPTLSSLPTLQEGGWPPASPGRHPHPHAPDRGTPSLIGAEIRRGAKRVTGGAHTLAARPHRDYLDARSAAATLTKPGKGSPLPAHQRPGTTPRTRTHNPLQKSPQTSPQMALSVVGQA